MNALQYRHYNLPIEFPVIAFIGSNWTVTEEAPAVYHFHNCMEIGRCNTGSGTVHTFLGSFPYHEGDLLILPGYTAHTLQSEKGTQSRWEFFYFDPGRLFPGHYAAELTEDSRLFAMSESFCPVIASLSNPLLADSIHSCFREFHEKQVRYRDLIRGDLLVFLVQFLRLAPALTLEEMHSSHKVLTVFPAIQHISSCYGDKLDIPALAEMCHISPTHFRRLFHAVMGTGPLEYINHARIHAACRQLLTDHAPVGEIAKNCGFATLSSFNRTFRQLFSASPSQWKKEHAQARDYNSILSLDTEGTSEIFSL